MKRLIFIVFSILLLVTACGGTDTSDTQTVYDTQLSDGTNYRVISSNARFIPTVEEEVIGKLNTFLSDNKDNISVVSIKNTYSEYYGLQKITKIEIYYEKK